MKKDIIKIIIYSLVTLITIGLVVLVLLVDINLGFIKTTSVKNLLQIHKKVSTAETSLISKEKSYADTLAKIKLEENSYKTEKKKYEAISNETINMIKEATTKQNYSIEYMWIKLGNYAKVNNLGIVITEPNGKTDSSNAGDKNTDKNETGNTTTSTTGEDTTSTETPNEQKPATETSVLFKLQVTGSYINVSDFIFAVENDKELRFKLDNIVIEYVSGTTIKATFNVKDMVIKK